MEELEPAPIKPALSMADLEKLDVRVGTIRPVEEVPESSRNECAQSRRELQGAH